jgi:hypothetical protein
MSVELSIKSPFRVGDRHPRETWLVCLSKKPAVTVPPWLLLMNGMLSSGLRRTLLALTSRETQYTIVFVNLPLEISETAMVASPDASPKKA